MALVILGRIDDGLSCAVSCIFLADELAHPQSTAHGLTQGAIAATIARDHAVVYQYGRRLAELADKFNFPPQSTISSFLLGWVEAQERSARRGLSRMAAEFNQVMRICPHPEIFAAVYAEELLKTGRAEDALATVDRAFPLHIADTGFYLPEMHRIRGDCLLALGYKAEAHEALVRADVTASRQGANLFKVRAGASLVRLRTGSDGEISAKLALQTDLSQLSGNKTLPDFTEAQALLCA
jgi:hypothetical protein